MKAIIKETTEREIELQSNTAWKKKFNTYDSYIVIREKGFLRIWDDEISYQTHTPDLTDYVEVSLDEARAAFDKTIQLLKV